MLYINGLLRKYIDCFFHFLTFLFLLSVSARTLKSRLFFFLCHLVINCLNSSLYLGAFFINGCLIIALAEGRAFGSFVRHCDTKSLNTSEKRELILGGYYFTILYNTFACFNEIYGGSPSVTSRANIPKDQMSTARL